PWGPSTATERLLEAVAEAGRTVGQDVVGRPAAGAADTNLSGAAGIPSLDGFAPVGGGAHAAHEHVLIASVAQRAALLAAVLATA
ncbi:MAG: M20/M25/M40 family metallo-hydrolase, partial [Cellulomonas sp.]|nr:M20/M25/M40 family metallo-hydrolase [Cellulomonas sp.]